MSSRLRADRRVGLMLAGIVFLTFVAVGATVALPAADPHVRTTKDALTFDAIAMRGMKVYRNEGCWTCHTQSVRNTPTDAVYGASLEAGAYANESPVMLGFERIGPDLTHVGSRYSSAADLIAILTHPRSKGRVSSMPSYGYLSAKDLRALAAYLLALR